jgi:hypothetical protein
MRVKQGTDLYFAIPAFRGLRLCGGIRRPETDHERSRYPDFIIHLVLQQNGVNLALKFSWYGGTKITKITLK